MSKKFQDLDLKHTFLFAAALEDKETCRMILEVLLDMPIPEVTVRAEHSILFASDFRSIRLDIYASDEMQVEYNLEMQNQPDSLAKRSRYHQAQMDVFSLKPGEDFDKLHPGYVIFICTFDPFGKGMYRYIFENRCLEEDFPLEDGTRKIFLNTKGTNSEEVPEALVHFLHYVEDSTDTYVNSVQDARINRLHEKITDLKKSRVLEERYMRFDELMKYAEQEGMKAGMEKGMEEGMEKGRQEGLQTGQNRILSLIDRMLADGQEAMLPRLKEPAVLEEMLKQYCI